MSSGSDAEAALSALRALHREIDRRSGALADRHADRLQCARGCASCCVDGLTVFPVEAERIRRSHRRLLEEAQPHPRGGCAFLDAGRSCRIYPDRPSVCRSQGLPLRMLLEDESDEIVERRDICPLNLEGGPPLESLAEDDCWLVGPFELRLAAIDERFPVEANPPFPLDREGRVALRSLFTRGVGA